MNSAISTVLVAAFLIFPFSSVATAGTSSSPQIHVPASKNSDAVHGQIELPSGRLEGWAGSVIIFISAGGPSDRDGWQLRASETVWKKRYPLRDLSTALVESGIAVVRFDNPGGRSPSHECRKLAELPAVRVSILESRCLDIGVMKKQSVARYVNTIENVVRWVSKRMPLARENINLLGFSEGGVHAAAIVERNRINVKTLIALGSPADPIMETTRWQAVARMTEELPEFDLNRDGIITNSEIHQGYAKGTGTFMAENGWLSPNGQWIGSELDKFSSRFELWYREMLKDSGSLETPGKVHLADFKTSAIPDITDSFWHLHLHGQISVALTMWRHKTPGLFIWGDMDRQISIPRQVRLVEKLQAEGAPITYLRFPERHHLLSQRADLDWFEPSFASSIASSIAAFLESQGSH